MNATRAISFLMTSMVTGSLFLATATAGEVLYEDNFESLDPAWGEPSDVVKVKDNKLIVQPPLGMSQTPLNQGFIFEDFELTGKVRLVQGNDPNQYAGLAFWAEDFDNYYAFTITTDGRFGVIRRAKGRWLYPVSYRASAAIKQGVGQWNELRVVTKANMATVFINGQQVVSLKGQPPQGGGMIGVHGESGKTTQAVCEFSNIKVAK